MKLNNLKVFLQGALCFVLAVALSVSAYAISDSTWDDFGLSGVYYYNPTGGNSNCVSNTLGNGITIIGDSITNGSREEIKKLLPNARIYAQDSKHFGTDSDTAMAPDAVNPNSSGGPSGFSIAKFLLAEGTLGATVVFALGSNDSLTDAAVKDIVNLLGSSRTIYFMTSYDSSNANRYTSNNNIVTTIAASSSNVHIIDWAAAASADSAKYIRDDHIHPTAPEGRTLFAEIINKAVLSSTSAASGATGGYTNYAGVKIFNDAEIQAIEANRPFYEAAATKYGFPWQILATLHYAEYSFRRSNPSNGQGVYQLFSYVKANPSEAFLPEGPISDEEFARQTDIAANQIANHYGAGLNLNDSEDIKLLFFKYNGKAQEYITKARKMGFTEYEAQHGAGSYYVMNRYDAQRDPTSPSVSPYWKGRFTADGVYDPNSTGSTDRFGTYVVYEALGGLGFCMDGGLVSGGMSYEQAYEFVKNYVDNPSECTTYSDMCNIFAIEVGGNCSTFSSYFLGKYTSLGKVGLPRGRLVVESLKNSGLPTGTEPRPYAIFSTNQGSTPCDDGLPCGHTGVVLGINEDANEIYIGQMGYSKPRSWGLTVVRNDLTHYRGSQYTYAYTEGVLKGNI